MQKSEKDAIPNWFLQSTWPYPPLRLFGAIALVPLQVFRRAVHLLLERSHLVLERLDLFPQGGFLLFPLGGFRFIGFTLVVSDASDALLLPQATEERRAIAFAVKDQQEAAAVLIRFKFFFRRLTRHVLQ